jgi:hypothetical protein
MTKSKIGVLAREFEVRRGHFEGDLPERLREYIETQTSRIESGGRPHSQAINAIIRARVMLGQLGGASLKEKIVSRLER